MRGLTVLTLIGLALAVFGVGLHSGWDTAAKFAVAMAKVILTLAPIIAMIFLVPQLPFEKETRWVIGWYLGVVAVSSFTCFFVPWWGALGVLLVLSVLPALGIRRYEILDGVVVNFTSWGVYCGNIRNFPQGGGGGLEVCGVYVLFVFRSYVFVWWFVRPLANDNDLYTGINLSAKDVPIDVSVLAVETAGGTAPGVNACAILRLIEPAAVRKAPKDLKNQTKDSLAAALGKLAKSVDKGTLQGMVGECVWGRMQAMGHAAELVGRLNGWGLEMVSLTINSLEFLEKDQDALAASERQEQEATALLRQLLVPMALEHGVDSKSVIAELKKTPEGANRLQEVVAKVQETLRRKALGASFLEIAGPGDTSTSLTQSVVQGTVMGRAIAGSGGGGNP